MDDFPRPIEGGNSGDGSPLVLGDEQAIGDLFVAAWSAHIVDWDADGQRELVCSGGTGDIYSFKFIDTLPDGTPIVDRGARWGLLSRQLHRNELDQGLTGGIAAVGDFNSDSIAEVILCPRGYSAKPTIVFSLKAGAPATREGAADLLVSGAPDSTSGWARGNCTAVDWNGDGRADLVVLSTVGESPWTAEGPAMCPEDQRDRYDRNGRWVGVRRNAVLDLYRNTSSERRIEFKYAGRADVELPPHAMHISTVAPDNPEAGLLVLGYYGDVWYLPLALGNGMPSCGEAVELLTLHGEPFNRCVSLEVGIGVSDILEAGRFDVFSADKSGAIAWFRCYGRDAHNRPIYDTPRKLKQRNPHVNAGQFSVVTVGDWRDTGRPDLLVGGLDGHISWYKTLATDPLRFAPPERVRLGTTAIRCLAVANPSAGHHWGGSQGPYDGNTGGYSNPVLTDWDGDGLLDLVVSDMLGLYDWYPNWGTRQRPELGPPQRLHLATGEPLFGPWRQQPGIGDFTGDGLPDVVIQDLDLDLALYRRVGRDDLNALLPAQKLRYEDGDTIKTHGVYTPQGGDGRGRTKINVVDWDGDGKLDLLIGVGPQHGSPYRGSYVLWARNVGSNEDPVFGRPAVLLFDSDGAPLEFWRHGVHMAPVDWDGDGKLELVAGADQGYVWYWKPEYFGEPVNGDPTAALRPPGEGGLGRDD